MARNRTTHGREDQYTAVGVALGAGIGMTIGVLIGGWAIPVGISVGAGVGVALVRQSHFTDRCLGFCSGGHVRRIGEVAARSTSAAGGSCRGLAR